MKEYIYSIPARLLVIALVVLLIAIVTVCAALLIPIMAVVFPIAALVLPSDKFDSILNFDDHDKTI